MAKEYNAEKENEKRQKSKEKQEAKNNKAKGKESESHAKQKVKDAEKSVKNAEKAIKDNEKRIKDLEKQKKKAEEKSNEMDSKIKYAQDRLENMKKNPNLYSEEEIAQSENELAKLQSQKDGYDDEIKKCNSEINQCESSKSKLEQNKKDAESKLAEEKQRYQEVKNKIANGDFDGASNLAHEGDEIETDNEDDKEGVDEFDPSSSSTQQSTPIAPWDTRLYRTDAFTNGAKRIPFSSEEASSIYADMVTFDLNDKGHGKPVDKKQAGILENDPNIYGLLSLINPYSVTRLYNSLKDLSFTDDKHVKVGENRMLDIRDQKRFYDTKVTDSEDILSVSNPTVTNIIQLMNNDRWGRTPYTYQDFVFCKYFGRIPNNRLITLRKYAAPTLDNLCWEMMGEDAKQVSKSFAPIATACTYFGGETGNSLKDLFNIESGLNWEELKAEIWSVTGDSGESQSQVADQKILDAGGDNGMASTNSNFINSMFRGGGKHLANAASVLKFIGVTGNPNVFDQKAANADKYYDNLHDPNDNGPYANRIQGPLNRIDRVMKRKEGIKFNHKINLKFSFEARPIGNVNTKAAMMEIISNMLMLCSASAVFWGGGHRFQIQPHAYPWNNLDTNTRGFLKSVYNGNFFGQKGAIAQALQGIVSVGHGSEPGGGFNFKNVIATLGNIGASVMGVLGGALNTLVGSLTGSMGDIGQYIEQGNQWAQSQIKSIAGESGAAKGATMFSNILKNTQSVWKANSVKKTILPSVQGLRSLLLGTPVGNWHLTVGNPLNPIAVIGNLICQDIKFEFGEELGPDDFPINLDCTVVLEHGMPRDLDAIESMFNRGAGRIYQAPDYIKFWGKIPASESETRVDAMTGNTQVRVPHAFMAVEGNAGAGKYYSRNIANSSRPSNAGKSSKEIETPINGQTVIDYNRGGVDVNGNTIKYVRRGSIGQRSTFNGNLSTRHYADS